MRHRLAAVRAQGPSVVLEGLEYGGTVASCGTSGGGDRGALAH